MIRVTAGEEGQPERVWTGPEPVDAAGLRLKRAASAVLAEVGGATSLDAAIMRIQAHPLGLELRRQTFGPGWTIDGEAVTEAVLDRIEADPERCQEPWAAMLDVWIRLGFLGPALRRAVNEAAARKLRKESSPTPTESPG